MTATRDRRSDPAEDAETPWDDRPVIGESRGLPWWGAVALAFGLAAVGAIASMQFQGTLSPIFQGAYLLGCVGAVCAVRRRSLFGPMVQPPLVFAVTAIGAVVLLGESGSGGGLGKLLFSVALSLTSNFPTMAIGTALTVAIGLYRLWKERDPNPPVRMSRGRTRPAKEDRPARPVAEDEPPRRDRPGKDRAAPAPRPRARDRRPDDEPEPRRAPRARREPPPAKDRGRTPRRDRDEDPPPRRRDQPGEGRPRREDRDRPAPSRRDDDRDPPRTRQPRRRPPEPRR